MMRSSAWVANASLAALGLGSLIRLLSSGESGWIIAVLIMVALPTAAVLNGLALRGYRLPEVAQGLRQAANFVSLFAGAAVTLRLTGTDVSPATVLAALLMLSAPLLTTAALHAPVTADRA